MDTKGLSKGVVKAINTAVKYEYYNGTLEGFNNKIKLLKGADQKVLKFNKVHIRTHRRSDLLISKFAL